MKESAAFAPGRIEVLGNHTDYNYGYVLSCAIPLGITIQGSVTELNECSVRSEAFDGRETRKLPGPWKPRPRHWTNYPFGVIEVLLEEGVAVPGFEATFESTLPSGAGMSSSAALEISTAMFALACANVNWDPLRIARACRRAENVYAGVNCGLLDQLTSVAGKPDRLVSIDFKDESFSTIEFPAECCFLVFASGVPHNLVGGEYNERREQCNDAATTLGVSSLREATREMLVKNREALSGLSFRRAMHVVGENERVLKAIAALKSNDPESLGRLMYESHQSSIENFENSTQYLDLLVSIARRTKGIYGARLTGGGFGGAIVALCEKSMAADASEQISRQYGADSGNPTYGLLVAPWGGAHMLSDQ
jgi:galactokinase